MREKDDVESATDQAENSDEDEVKATPEELKARMRERIKSSRQGRIQQIRKGLKEKSYPLTPIYYCDAEGCSAIGDKFPGCPRCECFFYCSKACQIKIGQNISWCVEKSLLKNTSQISSIY